MKYRCHFTKQGRYVVGKCTDVVIAKKRGGETVMTNLQVFGDDLDACQNKMATEILALESESNGTPLTTQEYDSKTGRWS